MKVVVREAAAGDLDDILDGSIAGAAARDKRGHNE